MLTSHLRFLAKTVLTLKEYNNYVADAGTTTGVKPLCKAVQQSYVDNPITNYPKQNLVS